MRPITTSDNKQWIPLLGPEGNEIGLYNARMGIASLHVMMDAGYDTMINLQPPGSAMLITAGYKIGLQMQFRESVCKPAYQGQLNQAMLDMKTTGRLVVDEKCFGVKTLGIPRGFYSWTLGDTQSTALHEAESETGLGMWNVTPLHRSCADNASRTDATEYYHSVVNPLKKPVGLPEKSEQILGQLEFFDFEQLQHLVAEGLMTDSFTHTAINLMCLHNRDWGLGWLSCGKIQLPLREASPQYSMIEV